MFAGVGNDCVFVSSDDNEIMNMYISKNCSNQDTMLITKSIDIDYFNMYKNSILDKNNSNNKQIQINGYINFSIVNKKKCVKGKKINEFYNPRIVTQQISFTSFKKVIVYHNRSKFYTVSNFLNRVIITTNLFGYDQFIKINDLTIKKICVGSSYCKDTILTTCGKIFMVNNFDSDNSYDLSKIQIDIPDETVVDINFTCNKIVLLTQFGNLYETLYSFNSEPVVKIVATHVKTVRCSQTYIVYQMYNNKIYSVSNDSEHLQIDISNIEQETSCVQNKIIKFECSNNHLLVKTDTNNLYSLSLCTDCESMNKITCEKIQFISKVSDFPTRFHTTKSAKKCYNN